MARREFSKKVRVAVIKRATINSVIFCEKCGGLAKKFQVDHIIPDSHGGEPTLENAMLICEACYSEKNPKDTTVAAKLKRIEAKHLGATTAKAKIASRGFVKKQRPEKLPLPPRREIYDDV
jgi:5-methylcytosine-specific restriction endonuclease McrA